MVERRIRVGTDGREIAVLATPGEGPTILWCGGYRSDMTGAKAEALAAWGAAEGRPVVRFDYSGHGASGGRFEDGTIGRWTEEAQAVLTAFAGGDVLVVGSSMGGWIALLLARALRAAGHAGRLCGLVLVAPAPDFTERLMWQGLSQDLRRTIMDSGAGLIPDAAGGPGTPVTRALILDGRDHLLLERPFAIGAPVRILQGMADEVVPHAHALALAAALPSDDVTVTLVQGGDHRLSRPADIARLLSAVAELLAGR